MSLLIEYTLIFAVVLFLVALGGCFSEHSGVMNLGLEGIMVIGAMWGALAMEITRNLPAWLMAICVMLAAVIGGMLYSLLLAIPAIRYNADQTLIGTALNILATAQATVVVKAFNYDFNGNSEPRLHYIEQRKALFFSIGEFEGSIFMLIALVLLVIALIVMNKTAFGLRLQACGENPDSAASAGIHVRKMRYAGVLISGALAGLGGIAYITSSVSEWSFDKGVSGFGFLAMAVMIFGRWKPGNIALAALMFGFFRALSNVYMGIEWLEALNIPSSVYNALPYIISLLILAFAAGRSSAPKALGLPYHEN